MKKSHRIKETSELIIDNIYTIIETIGELQVFKISKLINISSKILTFRDTETLIIFEVNVKRLEDIVILK